MDQTMKATDDYDKTLSLCAVSLDGQSEKSCTILQDVRVSCTTNLASQESCTLIAQDLLQDRNHACFYSRYTRKRVSTQQRGIINIRFLDIFYQTRYN